MTDRTGLLIAIFVFLFALAMIVLITREETEKRAYQEVLYTDLECFTGHPVFVPPYGWLCATIAVTGPNAGHDSATGICYINRDGENLFLDGLYCP